MTIPLVDDLVGIRTGTRLEAIRARDRACVGPDLSQREQDRRWLLERVDELGKAAQDLKDDLLLRGQRDSDGIIVVNVSQRIWSNFDDALAALHAQETDRG